MSDTQRNFLILAAIALLGVFFSGVFGAAYTSLSLLLNIAFMVMIGAALWILHRKHADTISQMKPKHRLLLQSCGILLFLVVITGMMYPGWSATRGVLGVVVFLALTGALIYGMYWAWQKRHYRY